jgi:hemerythrin-like domain-containing protein
MLHACHERVRRSLELLLKVCRRVEAGRVDESVRRGAADVVRYFDTAAPQHHEDEEQHIFPRLLAESPDARVRAAVRRLQEDHLWMEAQWARLRTPLAALAAGHGEGCSDEYSALARRFAALYTRHVRREDRLVLPAAAELLDEASLRAIGREMASRRGVMLPD